MRVNAPEAKSHSYRWVGYQTNILPTLGTNWMPQNWQVMCAPFTRHSKDMIPSPSKGVLLPFPSQTLQGMSYGVYKMKSDQLGERWLVHLESISQLFGSEES